MATMSSIKKPTMTAQRARDVLQGILNDRKEIAEKSITQYNAINVAATILEQAAAGGANLIHEAGILRYHASNITATLFCDDYTRRAIKTAIIWLDKHIEAHGGGENA